MAGRYDNQRNTSPVVSKLNNKFLHIEKSQDDLSRPIITDVGFGWIVPIDFIETLPGSTYNLSYDILAITRNPAKRRLFNNCKIYVHAYAQDLKNIDEAAPSIIGLGPTGRVEDTPKSLPFTSNVIPVSSDMQRMSHDYSPSTFLEVPPAVSGAPSTPQSIYAVSNDGILHPWRLSSEIFENLQHVGDVYVTDDQVFRRVSPAINFCALPLAMYQQICVYNYMPRNLLYNNTHFFPRNEMHLKFSYDLDRSTPVYWLDYDSDFAHSSPLAISTVVPNFSSDASGVFLNSLRVRQFQGDPYNTGLPFPDLVRGDIPSLELTSGSTTLSIPAGQLLASDVGVYATASSDNTSYPASVLAGSSDNRNVQVVTDSMAIFDGGVRVGNQRANSTVNLVLRSPLSASGSMTVQSSVTMAQLRSLDILTAFRARNARTDGSYTQIMKAQYGVDPHYNVGKPTYIGGFAQDIVFSDVVQTSESSEQSPLGRTSSRGVSAGNGYIGQYHSDDFGYIMVVLSIVPDQFYSNQGIPKKWTRLTQDQFYFPVMEGMPPVAMKNKELYVSGDDSVDEDVFAYQEPMYEYRYRAPVATGKMSNIAENDEENAAYIMKRHFKTTPQLSYGFTGMFPSNIDYSVFSNTLDTPFILSMKSRISAVQPIPHDFADDTTPNF